MKPTPNEAIAAIAMLGAAAALANLGDPRAAQVLAAGNHALGDGPNGEPLNIGLDDVIAASVGGALAALKE
jgi:hypothetical protein